MGHTGLSIERSRGFLTIVAVMLLVVIALAIAALGYMNSADVSSGSSHELSERAFFAAQSGAEVAIKMYGTSPPAAGCAGLVTAGTANVAVGQARFTVTSATAYPILAVSSTVSVAVTSASSVIPVTVKAAGAFTSYAPHGRIRVELEEIEYSSTSNSVAVCGTAPCFIATQRGANSTTPAAHAIGVFVFQDNQCLIRSTGTMGNSKRIVEVTVK